MVAVAYVSAPPPSLDCFTSSSLSFARANICWLLICVDPSELLGSISLYEDWVISSVFSLSSPEGGSPDSLSLNVSFENCCDSFLTWPSLSSSYELVYCELMLAEGAD